MYTEIAGEGKNYTLEANTDYKDFQKVTVTEFNGPVPVKAEVTKADGTVEEIDASTPFYVIKDHEGNELILNAATVGHVDSLHIRGEDPGSLFDCKNFDELAADISANLPEGLATKPGVDAFSVEMGKGMGQEGLASQEELLKDGIISQEDIDTAETAREKVNELNKTGDKEAKEAYAAAFAAANPDCRIQFQVVRGAALVPVVNTPKRPTTELFMVWGPGAEGKKTLWTAAPGRNMPRHPIPAQFERDGGVETDAYAESEKEWFETYTLIGEEAKPEEVSDKADETAKDASEALKKLEADASFDEIAARIPEVKAMVGFDQKNDYHTLTVDEHTKKAVATVEADPFVAEHPKAELIALAMKLHDVAKPVTAAPKKNDPEKLSFIGHETAGEKMVREILPEYFDLSEEDIDFVAKIVGLHASALNVMQNFMNNPEPTGKKLKSYVKFVDKVAEIPGDMDLEEKMKIVFAINKADKSGGWNEESDMDDSKVKDVMKKAEDQTAVLEELEKALPALLEACAAIKAGNAKAGIRKVGEGEYEYLKPAEKPAKVEIPPELKSLGGVLRDKMKAVAEVYPKLAAKKDNPGALKGIANGLLKGKLGLSQEQVDAVLGTLEQ